MARRKPTNKQRVNGSAQAGGRRTPFSLWRERLRNTLDTGLTAIVCQLVKWAKQTQAAWSWLLQWQKIAIVGVLVALTLPLLLYCSWIMLARGRHILLARVWGISIYSEPAWYVLFLLSMGSIAVWSNALPSSKERTGAADKSKFKLTIPGHQIGLLPRARWHYVRGQYAQAQTLLDALLAREPDNAAAQELQALNARQRAQREEHATPPLPPVPTLLDSNFSSVATRLLLAVFVGVNAWGVAAYVRIGLVQGWDTTVWSGVTRYGDTYHQSTFSAAVWLSLFGLLCLLYLIFDIRGVEAGPIIEANVFRAAKWLRRIFRRI